MKVLFLIQGQEVPSARFRVLQYIEPLKSFGIQSRVVACTPSYYSEPKHLKFSCIYHASNIIKIASYIRGVLIANHFDVVFVQRELTPYAKMACLEELIGRLKKTAFVFDFDDSIHLLFSKPYEHDGKLPRILKAATLVITGNQILAGYAEKFQRNTAVLPTPIKYSKEKALAKLESLRNRKSDDPFIVGWSGTRSNLRYLQTIAPALKEFVEQFPQSSVRIMGNFEKSDFPILPVKYEYTAWSKEIEEREILRYDCGIMPLSDDDWARGKCAFKLLMYAGCGVPCVGSPVGMNTEVIRQNETGLLASNVGDRYDAMKFMLENPVRSYTMGCLALKQIEDRYSVEACAPHLANLLYRAVDLKQAALKRKRNFQK